MQAAVYAAFRADRVRDAGALLDTAPPRLLRAGRDHNVVGYRGWFYVIPHAMGPLDLAEQEPAALQAVWRNRRFDAAERELQSREPGAVLAESQAADG